MSKACGSLRFVEGVIKCKAQGHFTNEPIRWSFVSGALVAETTSGMRELGSRKASSQSKSTRRPTQWSHTYSHVSVRIDMDQSIERWSRSRRSLST